MKEQLRIGENVVAVLLNMFQDGYNVIAVLADEARESVLVIPGKNIVTNAGDLYYAQKAAGESPSVVFTSGGLRMGSNGAAPAKTDTDVGTFLADTGKAVSSGYPKTNDTDADNSGTAVDSVTWKFEYTTAQANVAGIAEGAICNSISAPTSALSHFLFAAPFAKTSANTLKVFVNHNFLGA